MPARSSIDIRPFLLAYVPPLVLLLLSQMQTRISARELLRDPLASTGSPPYLGALSNLGILMWCGAASVCLLSWYILRHRGACSDVRRFLLATAGLSSLLMFDDLYQIHERVAPRFLGIDQKVVLASYGGIALLYLVVCFRQILRQDRGLLCSIGLCFATSIVVDLKLIDIPADLVDLIEDGSKFLGISGWLVFCARRSIEVLLPQPRPTT